MKEMFEALLLVAVAFWIAFIIHDYQGTFDLPDLPALIKDYNTSRILASVTSFTLPDGMECVYIDRDWGGLSCNWDEGN